MCMEKRAHGDARNGTVCLSTRFKGRKYFFAFRPPKVSCFRLLSHSLSLYHTAFNDIKAESVSASKVPTTTLEDHLVRAPITKRLYQWILWGHPRCFIHPPRGVFWARYNRMERVRFSEVDPPPRVSGCCESWLAAGSDRNAADRSLINDNLYVALWSRLARGSGQVTTSLLSARLLNAPISRWSP